MNTKQLHYFLATIDKGSISGAARELDIAQPAISQQIAKLEHELQAQLFVRDFRGVKLTESGVKFLDHAKTIMRQIDAAKSDIKDTEENPCGTVVIGMTQSICNVLSVPLLAETKRRYPGIHLKIKMGLSYMLHDWLRLGKLDLALSFPDGADMTAVHRERLILEDIYLAVSSTPKDAAQKHIIQRNSISFRELAKHEVIVTGREDALGYLLHQHELETGIRIKKESGIEQLMSALRSVTEGDSMLLAPSSATFHLEEINQITTVKIVEPEIKREVFIMTLIDRPQSNSLRKVTESIKKVATQANEKSHWRGQMVDF